MGEGAPGLDGCVTILYRYIRWDQNSRWRADIYCLVAKRNFVKNVPPVKMNFNPKKQAKFDAVLYRDRVADQGPQRCLQGYNYSVVCVAAALVDVVRTSNKNNAVVVSLELAKSHGEHLRGANTAHDSISKSCGETRNAIKICVEEMHLVTPVPFQGAVIVCYDKDVEFDDKMGEGTTCLDGCVTIPYRNIR